MKSSRLFYIVYRLLNGGPVTAPELARQLEVSVRTVYRDVEALCQAGVPVATEQGRGGGIRLMDGFVMSKAFVSAGEQDRLMLAVKSLASATGGRDGELVQKLGALFKRPATDWLEVDLSRWGQGGDRDTRFDLIQQAILEKRLLAFSYAAAAGICRRRVKPARLCYKSSAWYLQGLCLSRGEYRTFKLNRMSALALADERFTEQLAPPPIEAGDGGPRRPNVVLRFSPRAAFRVYDEFGSESIRRDENGALIVTAGIPYTDGWLYGYLASFGGAAEVLSPPEARRGLALYAQRLYLRYQKDLTDGGNLTEDVMFDAVCCSYPQEDTPYEQEARQMEQKFCQSCGMPFSGDKGEYGTERNGAPNQDYCVYCYKDGAFTSDCTMEEMIDFCAPIMAQSNPDMTQDKAREMMRQFFPRLKRWAKA